MKIYKIYGLRLKNSDEIRYIGYTSKSLQHRLYGHLTETIKYNHKNACWIKKHKDLEGIDIILLEDNIADIKIAQETEIRYIKNYRENGYNLTNTTDGGEGVCGEFLSNILKKEGNPFYGKKHSEETKIRLSILKKDKYKGDKNPFYGKKHLPETKKKISEFMLGRYTGEDNPFYGKKHSEETREKMRKGSTNKKNTHSFKKVIQIDLNSNEIIKIWDSISLAAESILGEKKHGTYISAVCNGRKKQVGGYFWKYFNNSLEKELHHGSSEL